MSKEHKASIDGDQWAQCVQQRGWLWNGACGEPSATLILAHGAVKRVLIIGGGDGGMLREVTKHIGIEHITMVDRKSVV